MAGPVCSQFPERTCAAPATSRSAWGSRGLGPGGLRWSKKRGSVPCAATMLLGITTGCGPVRDATPSSRGESRVGSLSASYRCDLQLLFSNCL